MGGGAILYLNPLDIRRNILWSGEHGAPGPDYLHDESADGAVVVEVQRLNSPPQQAELSWAKLSWAELS